MAKGDLDFDIKTLFSKKWIKQVKSASISPTVASWDLGGGESAVLSYALKNTDHWAIIDDLQARRCAESLGCHYTGTVGIIVIAKRRGIISSVGESLNKLQNSGLWLSKTFIGGVLKLAGE